MANMTWTVSIEEDPETGDWVLPLPDRLLELQGWEEGDILEWTDNNDGTFTLKKVSDDE